MWSSVARNALVLSLLATIAGCAGSTDESTGSDNAAVIDGMQNGAPTNLPESVLIAVGTKDFCTGVLIAPKLVLTATHCSGNSYSVTAPYAPTPTTSKATIAGVVAHSNDFNSEVEKEDVMVLKLATAINLTSYPSIRDTGELGAKKTYGVGVGRDRESRNSNLVKSQVLTVTSGTDDGYTTGLESQYYSSGGDSGGPLFLSDARGNIVTPHVVIGIERQPDPPGEHFTRITSKVTALVAAQ